MVGEQGAAEDRQQGFVAQRLEAAVAPAGKHDDEGAPGIKRKFYDLNVTPDKVSRLKYLPVVLMTLVVIALGTGVWVVRRR
jgi:hypothetical protein